VATVAFVGGLVASDDLRLRVWTRIDVCHSGIEHWYPARVGCAS
jgi:hypothetical protein